MKSPTLDPTDAAAIARSLVAFVNSNIMAKSRPIDADDDLKAAGVDSMALLKILVFVESTFGFWMPAEDLAEHNLSTLGALSAYVAKLRNEGR